MPSQSLPGGERLRERLRAHVQGTDARVLQPGHGRADADASGLRLLRVRLRVWRRAHRRGRRRGTQRPLPRHLPRTETAHTSGGISSGVVLVHVKGQQLASRRFSSCSPAVCPRYWYCHTARGVVWVWRGVPREAKREEGGSRSEFSGRLVGVSCLVFRVVRVEPFVGRGDYKRASK